MYIHRNRPPHSPGELQELYRDGYDHTLWDDHVYRVQKTIEFVHNFGGVGYDEVVDLSCGDGTIALSLHDNPILGDVTEGCDYYGPIEETVKLLPVWKGRRLFLLTETLEHLDNPLRVLDQIAGRTDFLVLTTPVHKMCEFDDNPEHYWTYDQEGVEVFTRAAGFEVQAYDEIYNGLGYHTGIWWLS